MKKFAKSMPAGFREVREEKLACPHRKIITCQDCAKTYANIVEIYGVHYWMRSKAELAEFNEWVRLRTTMTQPIGYALWFGDEAIPYRFTVLFCKTCGEQHPRVDEMDELLDLAGDTFACENCGTEVR